MLVDGRVIENLYERITRLLEALPIGSEVEGVRAAVWRLSDAARARHDLVQLNKLYREAKLLSESMRRSAKSTQDVLHADAEAKPLRRIETGPGLPAGSRQARRTSSSWRRPHAPIQYPYGDPPTGWDTRSHDTTVSTSDSKSSPEQLARLNAFRRSRVAAQEAEDAPRRQCTACSNSTRIPIACRKRSPGRLSGLTGLSSSIRWHGRRAGESPVDLSGGTEEPLIRPMGK